MKLNTQRGRKHSEAFVKVFTKTFQGHTALNLEHRSLLISMLVEDFLPDQFSSARSLSRVWLLQPRGPQQPGLSVHHQLLEFTQTHVQWVGKAMQQSHSLLSPSPPAFNLSQHQGLFKWVSSSHQVAKVLEFQLQHQFFQWIFDWFPLGWTGWISLQSKDSQESSPTPQFKSINSSVLSFLYSPTLTSIHSYWKTTALSRWTFLGKVTSLLFNMLSRLVITFLPRTKHLLISWLQSPSAVILEPPPQKKNEVCHCFHCFPIYLPWSDGTRSHNLCFLNVEL